MPIIEKAEALLIALRPADVLALPPATRRRLAAACRHAAALADRPDEPSSGVLADLRDGRQA